MTRVKQLGRKLRQLHETRGMSQERLAAKARVPREHVARLEAGRHDPTFGTLTNLATALNMKMPDLLA